MAASTFGSFCVRRKIQEFLFSNRYLKFQDFIEYGAVCLQVREMGSFAKPDIAVPKRIKRSDTAILEALASTISRDYTAPHYKFHDDPYFIPASNIAKRTFALSKESGRKAAKWAREEYRDCFMYDQAIPQIKNFMPKPVYSDEDATPEVLQKCINDRLVSTSVNIYEALKNKGVNIDYELKQSLLELLCFFNNEDPPDEDYIEERWFRQALDNKRMKSSHFSAAEKLFTEIMPQNARSHAAMVRGLTKYMHIDRAWELYSEMQENQMPVDVDTYNSLLRIVCFLRESSESRWELTIQLLTNMQKEGIKPSLGTLNSVLETISRLGAWRDSKKFALQILAEMKNLGIEPSLGSYYFVLTTFCRERGPVSSILYDIMTVVNGKEFEIRHPQDVSFFVTAMDVCHNHLQDKELAYQVHNLLHFGNNYALIGDAFKESIYYMHFFKVICGTEAIDVFFEFYHKLVPHIYTPEPSVMLEIIQAIDLSGALQYIPQIWSDMLTFGHTARENLMDALLKILASNKPEEELQAKFFTIAEDIYKTIDEQSEGRRMSVIQWTGPMLGNVLVVYLNSGEYQKACKIMVRCEVDQNKIAGPPTVDQLQLFVQAAIKNLDSRNAVNGSKLMMSIGYVEAGTVALEILEKVATLTEMQIKVLKGIASSMMTEKPED